MGSKYKAKPLSRKEIRECARDVRRVLGIENELHIDVLKLLEIVLPGIFPDFNYEIVPDDELSSEALTYSDEEVVYIRESVYMGAANGNGRDRFTIVHEIAHFLMHDRNSVALARGQEDIETFEDPEWQADAFAGEFLMPYYLVKGHDVHEVMKECRVSFSAARCQLKQYEKIKKTEYKTPSFYGC